MRVWLRLGVLLHSISRRQCAPFNLVIRDALTTATRGHREFTPHTLFGRAHFGSMAAVQNGGKILIGVKRSLCVRSRARSRASAHRHQLHVTIKISLRTNGRWQQQKLEQFNGLYTEVRFDGRTHTKPCAKTWFLSRVRLSTGTE